MQTLNQLVAYLTMEKQNSDEAIREILRANHPIFAQLRKLLGVGYRVFFTMRSELSEWLKVREFSPVVPDQWDSPDFEEWWRDDKNHRFQLLKIARLVFDESGNLAIYTAQQWRSDWVTVSAHESPPEPPPPLELITDDDVPF